MNRFGLAFLAIAAAGPLSALAAPPVPETDFSRLHALVKPKPGEEKWQEIPWLTDLWEARRRAAAEGKPILLWEMDGHPLSCV